METIFLVDLQKIMNKPEKITDVVPMERIANLIYLIRDQKVMFDYDLAALYEVPTKALNQAVSRNKERFPDDFMFRLTTEEVKAFNRSQFVTGFQRHRDPRFPPRVFTQEGVAMLSGVLRSDRAVAINIAIMRTFAKVRDILATHTDVARKIEEHDQDIAILYDYVRQILGPPTANDPCTPTEVTCFNRGNPLSRKGARWRGRISRARLNCAIPGFLNLLPGRYFGIH